MTRFPPGARESIARRAATLGERIRALSAGSLAPFPELSPEDRRQRLEPWARVFSQGDVTALARRLEWDGIDLEHAAAALADPSPVADAWPGWTEWLDAIADEVPGTARDAVTGDVRELAARPPASESPFAELAVPVLRAARVRLRQSTGPTDDVLTTEAVTALEQQLLREVVAAASATWRAAFAAWTGGPSITAFVRHVLDDAYLAMLGDFPGLARQLAFLADGWTASTAEFLQRVRADRPRLAETFDAGRWPGRVDHVRTGASDPHDGRRRVLPIRFESGLDVVYKPRDLGAESAFAAALDWARARGLDCAPPTLRVLACHGYGWMAHARPAASGSFRDIRAYAERAGSLLCFAHVLRGRDLHRDNVVPTGQGPALVDAEVLLQPVRRRQDGRGPAATDEDAGSCLATGFVCLIDQAEDGRAMDVGGLRIPEGPLGGYVDDPAVVDHVVRGFADTYRFLLDHRERWIDAEGPLSAFAGCPVRVLPRRTQHYAQVLQALTAPAYQRDSAARSIGLDILARPFARAARRPREWPILQAERVALERFDVPRFTVRADETTVRANGSPIEADLLAQSGLEAVKDRLAAMSIEDLDEQMWQIRQALADSPDTRFRHGIADRGPSALTAGADAAREVLLDAATRIAGELLDGCRPGAPLLWPRCLRPSQHSTWRAHDLYDGTLGAPLLWAAVARCTRDARFARVARDAGLAIRDALRQAGPAPEDLPVGAGHGVGGLVYGFTHLGALLDDEELTATAAEIAAMLTPARIAADAHLDVMRGAAGAALALVKLLASVPARDLRVAAEACGDRLLAAEERHDDGSFWVGPPGRRFLGLAHGVAGVGLAFHRLAAATGRADFSAAASRAAATLLGHGLADGRWPVVPAADEGADTGALPMTAWCHGAPGISIFLAEAADLPGRDEIGPALRRAAAAIRDARPHAIEHACCGNAGRLDALLLAASRLRDPALVDDARRLALAMVDRAAVAGHYRLSGSGFEYVVYDPGFFRGLPGIACALLRLASGDALPSVPALA